MNVNGQELPISEPGEAAKYIAERNKAAATPGNVTHTVTVAPPEHTLGDDPITDPAVDEPLDAKSPDAPAAKAADAWTDPETGETKAAPTRGDKRLSRLWQEREAEKQMRVAAEKRLTDLEARLAAGNAAPAAPKAEPTAADSDALTTAAQARIRPKPDRAAIGTTYPTYEDYVEDCAIWGGELAAEKRQVHTETQRAQTAITETQRVFQAERGAAKADYADFEAVTSQNLPITQAIADATLNAPAGLKGHVQYWLGKHPDETARIAALSYGPALVAMGEVIATVKAARATGAADDTKPKSKPQSDAPPPPDPLKASASKDTPVHRVADPGASKVNPVEFIRARNAEVSARGRL